MEERRSAGIILYRRTPQGRLYLLLHYRQGHWSFPKGQIEPGEEPEEAARRELLEETQIDQVRILPGFRAETEYTFDEGSGPVHKHVTYFLGETDEERVQLSGEHLDYRWLGYEDALKQLTYEDGRRLLQQAEEFLQRS